MDMWNIDNIEPNEEDTEWAANFLYPDLRPAYPNHEQLVEIVAKVRAAHRMEVEV